MFIILDLATAIAGLMAGFFTNKPAVDQFDYIAAGGLIGCVGYHLYKEHMR